MAEETQKAPAAPPAQEVVVPEAEKPTAPVEKEVPPPPAPVPERVMTDEKPAAAGEEAMAAEGEKTAPVAEKKIEQSVSFKEESNVASELPESQRKALDELKKLVQEALNKHEFTTPPPPPPSKEEEEKKEETPAEEAAPAAEEMPEEEKKEETPAEEAAPAAEEMPATAEPPKPEKLAEKPKEKEAEAQAPPPPPPASEEKTEAVAEPAVVAEVVAAVVDDDGTKTVEAIEETIVPVSAPAAEEPAVPEKEPEATAAPPAEEPPQEAEKKPTEEQAPPPPPEEVFLWGVPLLGDERSDVILLKFLRARDFKVKEAFAMLKNTVKWRKEFGVEELLDEDLGNDYEKVVFTHGVDKQGRPVVYNVFGEFQNKELYQNTFSDAEKQKKFLKWLVQFLEKTVRELDFSPTGISSLVLVNDLKNWPGYGKRELYKVTNKFLLLLQDNYPEFVARQLCINVSWWYLAYTWVYLSVFTPRSKSKFVFAGPSKTAETLFKYIAPEHVPVQFGGHSRAGELEFTTSDPVTEVNIKPSSKHTVEFSFTEPCVLVWELRVVGWDVNYEAQFVPTEGYTVLVSKPRKMTLADEPLICDSYKVVEPGKLILTVDSQVYKKKKLLYRSKIKPSE
ncbi:hypothetical protein Ancab_036667 [Ancistrocladus abbreviatus]